MKMMQNWDYKPRMSEEALRLRDRMKATTDPKELECLKRRFYDLVDTRTVCVTTAHGMVRHCFCVSDDAPDNLELLKQEYYEIYSQLPDDEYHFFVGLHRAQDFMRRVL